MNTTPRTNILGLIAIAILLSSSVSVASAQGDVRSSIEAANQQWVEMLGRGDGAGIAALYTSNAQLRPPNSDVVAGRQAIEKYWQAAIGTGFKAVTLTTLELESCGDTATEVGTYMVPGEDGKVLDKGKSMVIWKRENGQWKLHRDMWNSDLPPAPAQ